MEGLKRSVDRRAKGYERVELADPDTNTASWGNVGGFPLPALPAQHDDGQHGSDSSDAEELPSPKIHASPALDGDMGAGQHGIHVLCLVHFVQYVAMNCCMLPYPQLVNFLVNAGDRRVTSESSYVAGWLIAVNSFSQFLAVKYWSVSSDSHGRKVYILMGMTALLTFSLFCALGQSVTALLIGFAIEGTFAPGFTMGQAYIVDASSAEKRAVNYALYYGIAQGAAIGVGAILGLLLLTQGGLRWPFFVSALLLALDIPLAAFALPESLVKARREPWTWRRSSRKGHPWAGISMGWKRSAHLAELVIAFCPAQIAYLFLPNTWINYTDAAFGWTTSRAGATIVLFGAGLAVAPRLLIGRLGEVRAMLVGIQLLLKACMTDIYLHI